MAEVKKAPVKITQPIVGFKVLTDKDTEEVKTLEVISPDMKRPLKLIGQTWKIKPPVETTGLYMTINDVVLNAGTPDECRRPFEIFLNSKHLESYMWVTSLTVTISGLMRAGNDLAFLPAQLMQIADPKSGGYFGKSHQPGKASKGQHYSSVVSEIGSILKYHFIDLGILPPDPLSIAEEAVVSKKVSVKQSTVEEEGEPLRPGEVATGITCPECHETHMQYRDGCPTCRTCSYSKCG